MKKQSFILILIFLLVLPVVFSVEDYLKINKEQNLTLNCVGCSTSVECNLTLLDNDKIKIVDNKQMIKGIPYYYTLNANNITKYGDYRVIINCYNSTDQESTDYYVRSNWNGNDFIGNNNTGIYLIIIALVVGCIYSSFAINKRYIISRVLLFCSGFVNLLGALFVVYFDITNADLSTAIFTLIIINGLSLTVIIYDLVRQVVINIINEKEETI